MNINKKCNAEPYFLVHDTNLPSENPLLFITHRKTQKAHTKTINLKYQLQHGMINLNYQMVHILHQIFKTILIILKKNTTKQMIILQEEYR